MASESPAAEYESGGVPQGLSEGSPSLDENEEEVEEEECRVCRGPAEEGRPLYKPCRCKGSIGLTHQDCLQSWLEVQRSGVSGACELCKTKFQFAPLYKDNAPERLPLLKFFSGVSEIVLVSWLPSILRMLFAVVLWLVVAPLLTAYLYQSWMVRPSAALSRFQSRELIWADIVTGLVVAGIVVVSLLSIMSLADFLRLEWNRPHFNRDLQEREEVQPQNVDDGIWLHVQKDVLNQQQNMAQVRNIEEEDSWDELDGDYDDYDSDNLVELEDDPRELVRPGIDNDPPQRPFPDIPPDDAVEMDINLAVDEMLGLRGPVLVVFRNILWVLAFNAIYLGFFAFVPRSVGYTFCSYIFNMTDYRRLGNETDYLQSRNLTETSDFAFSNVWSTIQSESIKYETIFRLEDVMSITAGYLMIAASTGLMQIFMSMWAKLRSLWDHEATRTGGNNVPEVADIFLRPGMDEANDGVAMVAIDYAVKTTFATVKVGVLLFVKMFILPIALGLALCTSTMQLIGVSFDDQVRFAGRDIFAFILMRWVAGITFMLLVTVSVLQLREVLHPDICSRVIRPQEPHPDLLGNLMKESLATHVRRMSMSFLVYSILLYLFIRVPTRALLSLLLPPFIQNQLKLKFAYCLSSRLQAPFELLTFHLVMLTILEKYKNTIGTMQHHWLRSITQLLGLSESLLPYSVKQLQHVGSRRVFADDGSLDPFWYDVAQGAKEGIELIEANKSSFNIEKFSFLVSARTKANGEKVLPANADYIRLPKPLPGRALRNKSVLLKTNLGKYRLRREIGKSFCIQLWEEIRDSPIPRPPEGWDDLGAGGAHAQGRWAWSAETKSVIENGVAERDTLYRGGMTMSEKLVVHGKLVAVFLLSWLSVVTIIVASFVVPLLTGRFLFYLLHVPDSWIHDPFGWFLGCIFFLQVARFLVVNVGRTIRSGAQLFGRSIPPTGKLRTICLAILLHVAIAPLQVGAIYNVAFVANDLWFLGLGTYPFPRQIWRSWLLGVWLIEVWTLASVHGVFNLIEQGATDRPNIAAWHGPHGRVRRFWNILTNAVFLSDWESVYDTVLVNDVALPVFLELCGFQAITIGVPLALRLGGLGNVVDAALFTRGALGISIVIRCCQTWKGQIARFIEALHRSAFERHYLIGEVLINYGALNTDQ